MMKLKNRSTTKTIVRNVELEEVQDFRYLGSYISTDRNIEREISARIGLAAQAFNRLQSIWKSTALQTKTKLKIYRSNVRSVLLYTPQKPGEPTKDLRVGSEALKDGVFGESWEYGGNSVSPIKKLTGAQASIILWRTWNSGAGDGLAMCWVWTRTDIHAQHSDGHHQEKGREAGHLALGEEP